VKSQVEKITPSTAAELLKRNSKNRPLRSATIKLYANEMRKGNWVVNGEAIKISAEGVLLDGQHRLNAVITSGVAIDSLVIRGLADSVFDTLDTGAKRTPGDVLSLSGIKNSKLVATAARLLLIYKKSGELRISTTDFYTTNNDILTFVQERTLLQMSANHVGAKKGLRKIAGYGGLMVSLHYLFLMANEEKCNYFFSSLETGAGLEKGNPILALRNRLLGEDSRMYRAGGELSALYIKAWNATLNKKQIVNIRFNPAAEEYPLIEQLKGKW